MKRPRFVIWESLNDGNWYWQLRAANGRVVADGGQGYSSRPAARRAVEALSGIARTARIEIEQ